MQKRRSLEGDLEFDVLIENMKIESMIKRVESTDKREHVTLNLARKLADSNYTRKKNFVTYKAFEKELYENVLPRYGLTVVPKNIKNLMDILYNIYSSKYSYLRLVAMNSFNALLDQFVTVDNVIPTRTIKEYFYKTLLISIYLSSQSLPESNNIHHICVYTFGCVYDKTDSEIKNEVMRFIKDPVPISNGKMRSLILEMYDRDISGMEFLRMIRFADVYRSACRPGNRVFTIPNDLLVLAQEHADLMERIRDRYRYYRDNVSSDNMIDIDKFLSKNKIKI